MRMQPQGDDHLLFSTRSQSVNSRRCVSQGQQAGLGETHFFFLICSRKLERIFKVAAIRRSPVSSFSPRAHAHYQHERTYFESETCCQLE